MVDIANVERFHYGTSAVNKYDMNVHDELHWFLQQIEIKNKPICILLNKWDLINVNSKSDLFDKKTYDILDKIGMIQYHKMDINILKSISMFDSFPNEVLEIIAEYAVNSIIAPCQAKRIHAEELRMSMGKGVVIYKPVTHNGQRQDKEDLILYAIICSYLPPYEYINWSDMESKVFKTSLYHDINGVKTALDWVCDTIAESK